MRLDNAHQLQDLGEVVRHECVTGKLARDGDEAKDEQALPVAGGAHEVEVCGGGLRVELEAMLDLRHLVLDKRVVLHTVGMVLGQRGAGGLLAPVLDEIAGRLGHEAAEGVDRDHTGAEALEEGRETPGPGRVPVEGAKADPGGDDGAELVRGEPKSGGSSTNALTSAQLTRLQSALVLTGWEISCMRGGPIVD